MVMPDSARPPTVAIVTLGCGRNEVDSANIAGMLSASGFEMVEDPGAADAVLVNTCAFITAAKQESIDTILAAVDLKSPPSDHKLTSDVSAQAAKRESIDTILAAADLTEQGRASAVFVTGCLAGRYRWCSPRRPGSASRRGRDPRVRSLWSSWLRDVTVTARSAPSRPSAAASARGGRPRFWTRWRGSPVMASPRSAWSRRTPPATARTSAGASC